MTYFITGTAGFIGFHLAQRLLREGGEVFGIDNLNPYYDPKLKRDRLEILRGFDRFGFEELDLLDRPGIERVFEELSFTAPDRSGEKVTVDAAFVEKHLGDLSRSTDLSRYVL